MHGARRAKKDAANIALLLGAFALATGCADKPLPGTSADDIVEAASKGDLARVTLLVDEGADVTMTGRDGVTALHHAGLLDNAAMAELLLDRGADPDAATASQETPMHWAASGGSADVIRLLLKAGAEINARNDAGDTPLDVAQAADSDLAQLVERLRASGAKTGEELDGESVAEGAVVAPKFRGE